ncbi:MAG: hypothetical protein WC794_01280 [Candidatus Doudnabacteria bacterium]
MKNTKLKLLFLCLAIVGLYFSHTPYISAFSYRTTSPLAKVLGDNTNYPYPSGSLINDAGTVYLISGGDKIPFTNSRAFIGLGYSFKNVLAGNLTNYRKTDTYTISTADAPHPWGSWLIYKQTVYYSHETGLIGVPSWEIFLNNGGKPEYILKSNTYDIAEIIASQNIPLLTLADSRVYRQPFYEIPLAFSPLPTQTTTTPAQTPTQNITNTSPTTSTPSVTPPATTPATPPISQIPPTATSTSPIPTSTPPSKLNSIMGSYYVPQNFPQSILQTNNADIDAYFVATKQLGGHISVLQRWDEPDLDFTWQLAQTKAKALGLKFYLYIDPLTGFTREAPAIPAGISSSTSFSDPAVRQAFKTAMLRYASYHPDVLGIGTEVNVLLYHNNQAEFDNYVSLEKETYAAIKQQYPNQVVTVSFSWDIMRIFSQMGALDQFKNSVDIFTFTTYPNVISTTDSANLPADFFSAIRTYLPSARIGFAEMSWYAGGNSSEDAQKKYYQRLPELLTGLNPEFITITYLYDLPSSFTTDTQFNSAGLLHIDGSAKPAWQIVKDYGF